MIYFVSFAVVVVVVSIKAVHDVDVVYHFDLIVRAFRLSRTMWFNY